MRGNIRGIVKGPYERLKYDLRRVWECPICHRRERTDGTHVALLCRCQAKVHPLQTRWMQLVEEGVRRTEGAEPDSTDFSAR